jgi:hypothetical protein
LKIYVRFGPTYKITGVDSHLTAVDLGRSGYGAVTRGHGDTAIDAFTRRPDTGTELSKGSWIYEELDPFPGGEFSPIVLTLYGFDASPQKILFLNLLISINGFFHSFSHYMIPPGLNF